MSDETTVRELVSSYGMEIVPAQASIDISGRRDYVPLEADKLQRARLASLGSQVPMLTASSALNNGYYLRFPNGVQGTLMNLRSGGQSTTLIGPDGKMTGTAALFEMKTQAALLGAVSIMGMVSSQYYLSEINNNLKMMRMNIDKILEFLYGDKKAELIAEMSFIKYASQNFASIMAHESQKQATLISLQESRKIAMKDIEFYMRDLDSTVNAKGNPDLNDLMGKAIQIRDSLELSAQLCLVSNLLEVYYSENFDRSYIQYVEKDLIGYIEKLDKQILGSFAAIGQMIQSGEGKIIKKAIDISKKDEILKTVESLKNGSEESTAMRNQLRSALDAPIRSREYYIATDGKAFMKTA